MTQIESARDPSPARHTVPAETAGVIEQQDAAALIAGPAARPAGHRRGSAGSRWAKFARAAAVEVVTAWQCRARQDRLLVTWWLLLPAAAIVTGAVHIPGDPGTAIGLMAVAVALLCRFTWPIGSLLAGTGVAMVALLWPSVTLSVFLGPMSVLLAYAVGRQVADVGRAVAALAVATGVQAVTRLVTQVTEPSRDVVDASLAVVTTVLLLVLPGAIGMLQGERARAMDALRERNALLERANQLGEAHARTQERARITGEMHDLLGHRLSLIVLYAGALEMRARSTTPEIGKQADLVRATSRTALDELRAALGILRLDGAEPQDSTESVVGTREDVTKLVAEARLAGLSITLSWHGGDLTDADVGIRRAVNRIVREALTNVHKHAPGAPTRLAVTVDPDELTITMRNAMRRPAVPPPSSGMGLAGLRERARLADGGFTAGTDPITGDYTVAARLPLRQANPGRPGSGRTGPDRTGADRTGPHKTGPATDGSGQVGPRILPARNGAGRLALQSGSPRTTGPAFLALTGVAAVVCGSVGFGASYYAESALLPRTYRQVSIGDAQDRVRELTGGDNRVARSVGQAAQLATPDGTTCDYALADGLRTVFRFCFKDGKLVQKDEIQTS